MSRIVVAIQALVLKSTYSNIRLSHLQILLNLVLRFGIRDHIWEVCQVLQRKTECRLACNPVQSFSVANGNMGTHMILQQ
jgi:hypothetical protein